MFLICHASKDRSSAALSWAGRETPILSRRLGKNRAATDCFPFREHIYHSVVDEYPKLKRFVRFEADRRRLWNAESRCGPS